ncbi:MAG: PAS domain-containing protein [Calditrichaeota bacterium]|nr:MAG: PAS domain-containing protein [Calditrichota bacterium]
MKIKTKFLLFVTLLHFALFFLSLNLLEKYSVLFFTVEILIVISFGLSLKIYQDFIRPLGIISSGIESIKDKDFSSKFLKVGHSELDNLIEVYNKMIEQLRIERTKQEEQNLFLAKLIEASPSGIIILDLDEKIFEINHSALTILKSTKENLLKRKLSECEIHFLKMISQLNQDESKILKLDGSRSFKVQKSQFLDRGFPRTFILIEEFSKEIHATEKKSFEKVIRMMSHEINNSIGAVNSILESILEFKSEISEENREDFNNALEVSIERNSHLNSFMKNFAEVVKIPIPNKEKINLNEFVSDIQQTMKVFCLQKNIELKIEFEQSEIFIFADKLQIEQVLVNAIKNSVESISANGTILLKTTRNTLTIQDNGKGIPSEIENSIFTPFFSSKKNGQGIGLTISREILSNHKFNFSLKTLSNGLTEFKIIF